MEGPTQEQTEKTARYLIGCGVVFACDFLKKNVGEDWLEKLDLFGAYVIKVHRPIECVYISFGVPGFFMPDAGVMRLRYCTKSVAEGCCMANLLHNIDPANKLGLRCWTYQIDLKDAIMLKRPTDDDIVDIHIKYRLNGVLPARIKAGTSHKHDKLLRELRVLDRRRYRETGVVPPIERQSMMNEIKSVPKKKKWAAKAGCVTDEYRSDTESEVENVCEEEEEEEEEIPPPSESESEPCTPPIIQSRSASPSKKRPRPTKEKVIRSKYQQKKPKTFESILEILQAKYQQKPL